MDIKVTVNATQERKIKGLISKGSKTATESKLTHFFDAVSVKIEPTSKTVVKTSRNTRKHHPETPPEWLSDLPDFDYELSLI